MIGNAIYSEMKKSAGEAIHALEQQADKNKEMDQKHLVRLGEIAFYMLIDIAESLDALVYHAAKDKDPSAVPPAKFPKV